MLGDEELTNRFTYHAPTEGQPALYQAIRNQAHDLGQFIDQNAPDSREKSLAFTALEECVMWANASIARSNGGTQHG